MLCDAFARYVGNKGSHKGWTKEEPWALQTWLRLLQHIPCSSSRLLTCQPSCCHQASSSHVHGKHSPWQRMDMLCKSQFTMYLSLTSYPVSFTLSILYCKCYPFFPPKLQLHCAKHTLLSKISHDKWPRQKFCGGQLLFGTYHF